MIPVGASTASNIYIPANTSSGEQDRLKVEVYADPEDPIFAGHYPHAPILPGVLLLEQMEAAVRHFALTRLGRHARLREIRRMSFLSPVRPGVTIRIAGEVVEEAHDKLLVRLHVEADQVKAKATLSFELSEDEH